MGSSTSSVESIESKGAIIEKEIDWGVKNEYLRRFRKAYVSRVIEHISVVQDNFMGRLVSAEHKALIFEFEMNLERISVLIEWVNTGLIIEVQLNSSFFYERRKKEVARKALKITKVLRLEEIIQIAENYTNGEKYSVAFFNCIHVSKYLKKVLGVTGYIQ